MSNDAKIASLEARIEELDSQIDSLQEQLLHAQLDQWEGRIDDMEVQAHLASLELRERLEPIVAKLRDRWLDAKEQVTGAQTTATDVMAILRRGCEQSIKDFRDAVMNAKTSVAG